MRAESVLREMGTAVAEGLTTYRVGEPYVTTWHSDWMKTVDNAVSGKLSLQESSTRIFSMLTLARDLVSLQGEVV